LSSKLRIRIGEVEIDYEGTEEFLKQELPQLLKTAMELHRAAGADNKSGSSGSSDGRKGGAGVPALTTGSIAAKLNATSGLDLLLAAGAHLTLVAKKETFSRQELLTEMQNASGYYKKSFSKNLTSYLNSALTDQKLTETAKNIFALSAKTRAELEGQLADA
jgi:hypothetical protein